MLEDEAAEAFTWHLWVHELLVLTRADWHVWYTWWLCTRFSLYSVLTCSALDHCWVNRWRYATRTVNETMWAGSLRSDRVRTWNGRIGFANHYIIVWMSSCRNVFRTISQTYPSRLHSCHGWYTSNRQYWTATTNHCQLLWYPRACRFFGKGRKENPAVWNGKNSFNHSL